MLARPFLTALDTRAAVKGSRDPLGLQPIWARLGRNVVGNLTTATQSARDFTITLIGYAFAEDLAEAGEPGSELATFLAWEQVAAYSRAAVLGEKGFRGTDRVWKRLNDAKTSKGVTISPDGEHQILSNQRTYGLWGLYSEASRTSGWLEPGEPRLTAVAREFVDRHYLARLKRERTMNALRALLTGSQDTLDTERRDRGVCEDVAVLIRPHFSPAERDFYRTHLLLGGPGEETGGLQECLVELLGGQDNVAQFAPSPTVVGDLARRARRTSHFGDRGPRLATALERIRTCEAVLAPVSKLFTWLQGQDGVKMPVIVERLDEAWRGGLATVDEPAFTALGEALAPDDGEGRERWAAIAHSMAHGESRELLAQVLEQNRAVLAARAGSPWVVVEGGRLRVRFRDEAGMIPPKGELRTLWRHPYFLESLARLTHQIGPA